MWKNSSWVRSFSFKEMNVVHKEQIHLPVTPPEVGSGALLDCVDQFVHELLGGDVGDPLGGVGFQDSVSDGVHEVGLAQSHATVKEEGVVHPGRVFGHTGTGCGGQLIVPAHHEPVEGIAPIQPRIGRLAG